LNKWDKKLKEFKKKVYESKLKLQLRKVRCRCELKHSALVVCQHRVPEHCTEDSSQPTNVEDKYGKTWPVANKSLGEVGHFLTTIDQQIRELKETHDLE